MAGRREQGAGAGADSLGRFGGGDPEYLRKSGGGVGTDSGDRADSSLLGGAEPGWEAQMLTGTVGRDGYKGDGDFREEA